RLFSAVGEFWPSAMGGATTVKTAAALQRLIMPTAESGDLTEALEQLPELDGAEVLEAAQQILLRGLDKDPAGGSGGVGRDEMDPPSRRLGAGMGFQIDP